MYKIVLFLTIFVAPLFSNDLEVYSDLNKAAYIAKQENKDIMVVFHKNQCDEYQKIKKDTFKNNDVVNYINSKYVFVSIVEEKSLISGDPEMFILEGKTKDVLYSTYNFSSPKKFLEELKKNI